MEKNVEKRSVGFELKCVNNVLRRRLEVHFTNVGLEELKGMQGALLGYVSEHEGAGDVFQKDLEREFNVRRSTATVMLQKLEQKGYIVREQLDSDARLKKILLTDKAKKANQEIQTLIADFNDEVERGITKEERENFFRVLDKVRKNLE